MEFQKLCTWAICPTLTEDKMKGSIVLSQDTTIYPHTVNFIDMGFKALHIPTDFIIQIQPYKNFKTHKILQEYIFYTTDAIVLPVITHQKTLFKSGDVFCHIELHPLSHFLPGT
jgi:hypothetical protein